MQQKRQWMRVRPWQMALMAALFAFLQPQRAAADNFMQNEGNYTAMVIGVDKVQFTLPTQYDGSPNEGVQDGYVYVSVDGGEKQRIFTWYCDKYGTLTSDKESGTVYVEAYLDGTFQLLGRTSRNYGKTFTSTSGKVEYTVSPNEDNDDHFASTIVWTIPRSLRGRNLKFYSWAHVNSAAVGDWHVPSASTYHSMLEWNAPEAGQATVNIGDPMVAYDASRINTMMIPYNIVANKVHSLKIYYTDAVTNAQNNQTLGTSDMAGFAYIPADRPWKDVYFEAELTDVEGKKVDEPVKSSVITTNMLHHPLQLNARYKTDGNVTLTWRVENADKPDLSDTDMFEIQRNLTGSTDSNDPYWVTISMDQGFTPSQDLYTYEDNTLLSSYMGYAPSYRIRRSCTSVWSWGQGAGHSVYAMPLPLTLLSVANATVKRSATWNDENHIAQFSFDFEAGYPDDYMLISSENDWNAFCQKVVDANGQYDVNARLMADIEVGKGCGRPDIPYNGIFDGGGHTITLKINSSERYQGVFRVVNNATILNLRVKGSITTNAAYAGGLIGGIGDNGRVAMENCYLTVGITNTINGDGTSGGFVGVASRGSTLTLTNCLFDGAFAGPLCHSNGGMVGYAYNSVIFTNCLFNPASIDTKTDNCATWSRGATPSLINCYATKTYGDTNNGAGGKVLNNNQLLQYLGSGWKKDYWSNAVPKFGNVGVIWDNRAKLQLRINMHGEQGVESKIVDLSGNADAIEKHQFTQELSRKCVEYSFDLITDRGTSPLKFYSSSDNTITVGVRKVDKGDLQNYRFQNSDRITKLEAQKRQSSVVLSWETSGGDHDYFRVLRREHNDETWTDTVATNLVQLFYEDKTVLVQQVYDYRVESVYQCEGTNIESMTCTGQCETTGRIDGYVRMADGTAMGGITVECRPDDGTLGADALYTTITDETGYFRFEGLPYQTNGKYNVSIPVSGDMGNFTGPNATGEVSFTQDSNWTQEFNFYLDTYYIYSGNVYYRDTSIPVPGVSFKLDGKVIHDASQNPITTDTQGAFELSIPRGAHSVQAVKEGHYFAGDGYLINHDAAPGADSTVYNFVKNVASVYLWDSTTVVLCGRVVGGDIEGSKPLGSSLSANNLGDSLKIVMQLEGDNTSWLIRKQDDATVKEASYTVPFGLAEGDTTQVNVTRHTLTVRPDAKTGEFQVALHPAKYKVIEVSAQGYATLFQQGKVGETVDLSFNVQGDTCEYSRIYHAEPTVAVTQFNPSGADYFGVQKMKATDIIGHSEEVNIASYKHTSDTDSVCVYSFGYPVFMAGSPYGWMLQACERYYWNNNPAGRVETVNLNGGKVHIKNYLVGNEWDANKPGDTVELDANGGGSYIFTPQNATFTMEGDNALKAVDITLEYDGNYYDVYPLSGGMMKGYVMATLAKSEGRKSIVSGTPKLFDILRDPPGGGSSAYIEEGSKLSYSYSAEAVGSLGLNFSMTRGESTNAYLGTVSIFPNTGIGNTTGIYTSAQKSDVFSLTPTVAFGESWNYTYNIDVTERIQTSSGKKWVGPKADLFIGMTDNVIVQEALAVRVIPQSMYDIVALHEGGTYEVKDTLGNVTKVKVPTGTTRVLATGQDLNGGNLYLVRDEVLAASPVVKSTFVHSQHYIENELLPELVKLRNSLLLGKGTNPDDAQALANKKGVATYVSEVDEDDDLFGFNYTIYWPDKATPTYVESLKEKFETGDSIHALNQECYEWINFLILNGEEKLMVMPSNLVKRYDIDGASSVQYSETFTTGESGTRYLRYPLVNGLGNVGGALTYGLNVLFNNVLKFKNMNKGSITADDASGRITHDNGETDFILKYNGYTLDMKINVVATANFSDKFGYSTSHSKKAGFTLAPSSKSSLTVDVYRTVGSKMVMPHGSGATAYYNMTYDALENVRKGLFTPSSLGYMDDDELVYSNFVYRTIGGVTCQPYEGERTTKWYQPGTVLDVATIAADKPRIWIDEPVKSNVPYDEPARFKLHFANESDYPERATLIFTYYLQSASNPNGAKVYVDGTPINSQGVNITLYPCRDNQNDVMVFTKEIEVYPGTEFDYNDLTLCLYDPEDVSRVFDCKFSAHFVPTAGKVSVSSPSNNWVMNTESPYDGKRKGYYMPVRIEGFDTNYRGFDHIELQYKLSTQGDKDWVNVCSFYANDSLRAKASGVTDTIPNSGAIIAKFYGENDPIEQYYDLRAVNYCRHAGGFLTGASPVLKGIKDTRLPELFGTPEPVDGILGIGDDLKLTFSEPIAGNYLSKINNFELLGTPTNNDISTSTSLTFSGTNSFVFTQGSRNLTGKSFTVDVMLNPDADKGDMTVFWHGGDENGVKFGLTADRHLTAKVNGQTVTSDSTVTFNGILTEVAYVLDQSGDGMKVVFFDGSKQIGSTPLTGKYENTDNLHLGYDPWEMSKSYKGDMLEMRLWNRAMTAADLNEYGKKQLSGYESGLIDYYRMNEGMGEYTYDRAPGALDMQLINTAWKRPSGISMKINGKEGLRLKPDKFARSANHDYTLMFWFRLTSGEATLFSNGEATTATAEAGATDQLNIGTEDGFLYVRSDGYQRNTERYVADGEWHHFIMTVSRSRNVVGVYVDQDKVDAFAADNLAGISGDHIALGATYADKNTPTRVMTGNIDEVGMFESVLPSQLLNEFAVHTPMGELTSLMAYLDFGRSVRQDDNTMRLEPTGVSLKRYKDNQGNIVARRDTLIAGIDAQFVDRAVYAPMLSNSQLENLNFSYVANDNQLLVNIKEPDYTIEKTNVYLTVKEVPDLQGNLMASPVTMNVYVYRNPLRWNVKSLTQGIGYGEGATFEATIRNVSGTRQTYSLSELPVWITASQTSGYINALDEQTITFTVSPYINIGTYNEQIEVIGGNDMSEPLTLTLNVRGEEPEWAVPDRLKQLNQTEMMVARVKIDGVVASSTEDILGVFDENQQTLGVAHIEVDNTANANEALAYVTIYGYQTPDGTTPTLSFRFYDASTGHIYSVNPADGEEYKFQRDGIVGSASEPVELVNEYYDLEWLPLKKGWNWVTFNVVPKEGATVAGYLDDLTIWEVGDIIMTVDGTKTQSYTCRQNKTAKRGYKWDNADEPIEIDPTRMYSIYSMSDKTIHVEGYWTYAEVTVHKDWNRLGFTPSINLPLAQALSGYMDEASEGDIIKSQDGFAIATRTATGIVWKGSLQYMEVGKGYMLKRLADGDASFFYPLYSTGSRYSGTAGAPRRAAVGTATTMNIVATVSGVEVQEGDELVAYLSGERMVPAVADEEQHFFLNIGCDAQTSEPLSFVIERGGEPIATTASTIRYEAHKVIGTPNEPTDINFTAIDQLPHDAGWYTVSGLRLAKKPTRSGVYIHDGGVVVVK